MFCVDCSLVDNPCYFCFMLTQTSQDFEYGPGSILPLIAFLVSALVVFLQIGSTVLSPSAAGVPAQPRAQAVATNEL